MSVLLDVPQRWYSVAIVPTTNEVDVDKSVSHAVVWGYDGIQFDLTKAISTNRALVVQTILAAKAMSAFAIPVLFRVNAGEARDFIEKDSDRSALWNVVYSLPGDDSYRLSNKQLVTLKIAPNADLKTVVRILTSFKELGMTTVHAEFPFSLINPWREQEIVYWVEMLKIESGIEILPPLGFGLDDPELSAEDQVLPSPEMILRQNETTKPKISVVIPTFEKTVEVTNTVRHLLRQQIPFDAFEILMIDCGSHDTTLKDADKLITSEGRTSATTLLKIARPIRKRRGESRYRAGLAKNIGAAQARGQYLLFLDDDVLLPPDYLGRLLAVLEASPKTVFLAKCHSLKPESFGVRMAYEKLSVISDVENPDRGFWRDFYERHLEWMQFERPWRFVSTHTLALSKEQFTRSGWFRENFISYGFEDMELGFNLEKIGAKFQILPIDVFRQNRGSLPETPKARRANHVILAKAAQVFYRHTLHRDVYTQVYRLFRRPLWFWLWYDRVRTGGPFWRLRRREF